MQFIKLKNTELMSYLIMHDAGYCRKQVKSEETGRYHTPANCLEGSVIQRILARPLIETRAIDYTPIGSMDRAN